MNLTMYISGVFCVAFALYERDMFSLIAGGLFIIVAELDLIRKK